jgi:hypothetical protein
MTLGTVLRALVVLGLLVLLALAITPPEGWR